MGETAWIIFSLFCVIGNVVPFAWQLDHGNSGPVCLGFWVIVANLNFAVNALVWRNDAINRAPIWCDISVKLQTAAPTGILVSDICILALLARVMAPTPRMVTHRERKIRNIVDYSLSIGIPLLMMALSVFWMPYRFDLAQNLGCLPAFVNVWPLWAFYALWPLIFSLIGCFLASYVGYRLIKHRRNFKKLLAASDSALTTSRFVRLGLLSSAFLLFNLPLSIWQLVVFIGRVGKFYTFNWKHHRSEAGWIGTVYGARATLQSWSMVIAGLLVIVFFGFGNEALSYYLKPLHWLGLLKPRDSADPSKSVAVSHITLTRYEAESGGLDWPNTADRSQGQNPTVYTGPFRSQEVPLEEGDLEKFVESSMYP